MTFDIDAIIKDAQKETKDTIIKVRVSSKQKEDFMQACNNMNIDSSALIRAFMKQCIKKQELRKVIQRNE